MHRNKFLRRWTTKLVLLGLLLKVLVGTAHAALPVADAAGNIDSSLLQDLAVICKVYGLDNNTGDKDGLPGNAGSTIADDCTLCYLYQGNAPVALDQGTVLDPNAFHNRINWLSRTYSLSRNNAPTGGNAPRAPPFHL